MTPERALVTAVFALLTWPALAALPEAVVELPTRSATLRFLYLEPANPVAHLIVLPGDDGVLGLRLDGSAERELLEISAPSRNRQRFAAEGFAVAVVDAPSDLQVPGISGYRQSTAHVADVLAVIRYLRQRNDVPVWIVGHDDGAASAIYMALQLPPEQPVGVVVMAPRAGLGIANNVLSMPLREVRRPLLVISHANDPCTLANLPARIIDELTSAPVKEAVSFTGGDNYGASCSSGYHQFEGLGAEVVNVVANFVRKYGALVTVPAEIVSLVEFHHAGLDHYFMTWVPGEIVTLDAGTDIIGWTRTGVSWRAWRSASASTSPVCRFYIPPNLGDSHFFGRGVAECNETAAKNPAFTLEDPQFMHVVLPIAGECAGGALPIYRVFSNRADANHRYMTDRATRDQMTAAGWLAEGDGPDLVVMCARV